MIELIVWLILFSFLSGAILTVRYWYDLAREKNTYDREELIDFPSIIQNQLKRLTNVSDPSLSFLAIGLGMGIAWGLALFGGLVSPDRTGAPDYAEGEMPNYFFQSVLFLLILHLAWPSFRDLANERAGQEGILARMLDAEVPFFYGFTACQAAINLMVWGVHHEVYFLFSVVNALAALFYTGYRMENLTPAESRFSEKDDDEGPEF